jgi:hypothetical protein
MGWIHNGFNEAQAFGSGELRMEELIAGELAG